MIPKADGDSTPLGQRPPQCAPDCVQAVGFTFGLDIFGSGLKGWLPQSVFSLGNGLSSVEAWFSTILRRFLLGLVGISCTLWSLMSSSLLTPLTGRFWTLLWVGSVCLTGFVDFFRFIVRFVLGLSLLLILVSLGVGTVVLHRAVPLSMVFIVALCVPWCRHLEALPDVKPQLYADNLKCSAERPGASF